MSANRILILGGTGAMGLYLVPELLALGNAVIVTSRSERKSDGEALRHVCCNARDNNALREVIDANKPDAIVDFMLYSTAEFAARRDFLLGAVGRYLFLSSYRVFADSGMVPLTERSPRLLDVCNDKEYLATDEYALAKARQENLLRDSGRWNWTILRPCITYSSNRFQFGTLEANTVCYRALQGVPVIMAQDILEKQTTMTWGGDAARMIARLALNSKAAGEDFNTVTSEHRTWREIAGYYGEAIGLKVVETGLKEYEKVVGSPYQIKYDRIFDRVLDNAKALSATGLESSSFTPLREGLVRELGEFKKAPFNQYSNLELNARMDAVIGSRISLAGMDFKTRCRYFSAKHPFFGKVIRAAEKIKRVCRRCSVCTEKKV